MSTSSPLTVSLDQLDHEHAAMLLITLGCPYTISEALCLLSPTMTGELLKYVETIEDLKELGLSGMITPALRKVLRGLKQLQTDGISEVLHKE
jgi:hypothetical protein